MKKYIIYLTNLFVLLIALLFVISCDTMNDIQSKFADLEEQVYLGKVDSLKSYPGFGRAKITWYIGSDPKIEKTVILWNMRKDSIVKDFVRKTPGVQKDSIFLDNLPEGSRLFEFYNMNSRGEKSLPTSLTVTVWGADYAEKLLMRKVQESEFDYDDSEFRLKLSKTTAADNVVYSQIVYTDTEGVKRTIKIDRSTNDIVLDKFPDGESALIRSVFFLKQGVDTVYNNYVPIIAPKVTYDSGKELSIGGGLSSKYFNIEGTALGEWTSSGDLIIYEKDQDNNFTLKENYPGIVGRALYREFFYYDDGKYISIAVNDDVRMHKIVDGKLESVLNPSGAPVFGTGFSFWQFLPAKGFFFSFSALTKYELKTWVANNNATWGTPNGTTVAKDISYSPYSLFKYRYFIGVDENGHLWSHPMSTTGYLGAKSKNGSGWNRFKKIITVGDALLGLDENGVFWQYNFDLEHYWIVNN